MSRIQGRCNTDALPEQSSMQEWNSFTFHRLDTFFRLHFIVSISFHYHERCPCFTLPRAQFSSFFLQPRKIIHVLISFDTNDTPTYSAILTNDTARFSITRDCESTRSHTYRLFYDTIIRNEREIHIGRPRAWKAARRGWTQEKGTHVRTHN